MPGDKKKPTDGSTKKAAARAPSAPPTSAWDLGGDRPMMPTPPAAPRGKKAAATRVPKRPAASAAPKARAKPAAKAPPRSAKPKAKAAAKKGAPKRTATQPARKAVSKPARRTAPTKAPARKPAMKAVKARAPVPAQAATKKAASKQAAKEAAKKGAKKTAPKPARKVAKPLTAAKPSKKAAPAKKPAPKRSPAKKAARRPRAKPPVKPVATPSQAPEPQAPATPPAPARITPLPLASAPDVPSQPAAPAAAAPRKAKPAAGVAKHERPAAAKRWLGRAAAFGTDLLPPPDRTAHTGRRRGPLMNTPRDDSEDFPFVVAPGIAVPVRTDRTVGDDDDGDVVAEAHQTAGVSRGRDSEAAPRETADDDAEWRSVVTDPPPEPASDEWVVVDADDAVATLAVVTRDPDDLPLADPDDWATGDDDTDAAVVREDDDDTILETVPIDEGDADVTDAPTAAEAAADTATVEPEARAPDASPLVPDYEPAEAPAPLDDDSTDLDAADGDTLVDEPEWTDDAAPWAELAEKRDDLANPEPLPEPEAKEAPAQKPKAKRKAKSSAAAAAVPAAGEAAQGTAKPDTAQDAAPQPKPKAAGTKNDAASEPSQQAGAKAPRERPQDRNDAAQPAAPQPRAPPRRAAPAKTPDPTPAPAPAAPERVEPPRRPQPRDAAPPAAPPTAPPAAPEWTDARAEQPPAEQAPRVPEAPARTPATPPPPPPAAAPPSEPVVRDPPATRRREPAEAAPLSEPKDRDPPASAPEAAPPADEAVAAPAQPVEPAPAVADIEAATPVAEPAPSVPAPVEVPDAAATRPVDDFAADDAEPVPPAPVASDDFAIVDVAPVAPPAPAVPAFDDPTTWPDATKPADDEPPAELARVDASADAPSDAASPRDGPAPDTPDAPPAEVAEPAAPADEWPTSAIVRVEPAEPVAGGRDVVLMARPRDRDWQVGPLALEAMLDGFETPESTAVDEGPTGVTAAVRSGASLLMHEEVDVQAAKDDGGATTEHDELLPPSEFRPKKGMVARLRAIVERGEGDAGHGDFNPHELTPIPSLPPHERVLDVQPVRPPYAFVRVVRDEATGSARYEVVEPPLDDREQAALDFTKEALVRTMDVDLTALDKEGARRYLFREIRTILRRNRMTLPPLSRARIEYYVVRDLLGFGRIDIIMQDTNVEDVSCDGPGIPVFVHHRLHGSLRSNIVFKNDDELDAFVIRLVQRSGKAISVAEPLVDATLPDGSRLQASLSREVTTRGSTFTIRRFREDPFTPPDLATFGTADSNLMGYLWLAVEHGASALVCGGTASGKTTTLNALSLFIPPDKKVVTIEDTREINLPHENWIPGVTRGGATTAEGGAKKLGEVDMFDLLKAALRQRPEYLILGEIRGREAFVLFQAMATGHTVYSTMHADSVASAVYRLESKPLEIPRNMLTALDIVLIQAQVRIKERRVRRVREIVEFTGQDPTTGEILTNTVYQWDHNSDRFIYAGSSTLLDQVADELGVPPEEMEQEHARRARLLEAMRAHGVREVHAVHKLLVLYGLDPERAIVDAGGAPEGEVNMLAG